MIAGLLQYIYSLKNFAARLLNNNIHDAEDAIQDLAIKLWRKKELLETMPLIEQKKYACTSLFRICTDYHRRFNGCNSPRKIGHADELKEWHQINCESNLLEEKDCYNLLYKAISSLRNKERKLMLIMFFDGYKCREIAKVLDTSINNVTAGISGARLMVKKNLKLAS